MLIHVPNLCLGIHVHTHTVGAKKLNCHFRTTENFIVRFIFVSFLFYQNKLYFRFVSFWLSVPTQHLIDGSPMNNVIGLHTITIARTLRYSFSELWWSRINLKYVRCNTCARYIDTANARASYKLITRYSSTLYIGIA